MADLIQRRRQETDERLSKIKISLGDAARLAEDKACVYATGSFGRGEAGQYSDLDLFIVGRTENGRRALSNLDEICIKADLVEATRRLKIPDFSGDGEYLVHYEIAQLIKELGTPRDDAYNTFTARLLLLLESHPLIGDAVYDEAIDNVIAAYWRDFEDHKNNFIPAFLSNDILRLWRTFCVNYEANTRTEPLEKKIKRRIKNYKLKHSRLLTCYSALTYLLAVYMERDTVTPKDVQEMVKMRPTERLETLSTQRRFPTAQAKICELLGRYEEFLDKTNVTEELLVSQFKETSAEFYNQENEFGNLMAEVLQLVGGDSRLYRLLIV